MSWPDDGLIDVYKKPPNPVAFTYEVKASGTGASLLRATICAMPIRRPETWLQFVQRALAHGVGDWNAKKLALAGVHLYNNNSVASYPV